MSPGKAIYINLPSKDLEASKRFAIGLGLTFNKTWCNDMKTLAFTYTDSIQFFYHDHSTWEKWLFQGRKTADAHTTTQALLTLAAESQEQVDSIVQKAVEAGGKRGPNMVPEGADWGMYSRSVEDPDGHVFEIVYSSHSCP
ncbi:predicted protein [Uncinocarpus reesii 1704]|uniref:VOC domain-containing protein n=1 Tax=Uncinocarpus reesii (strain UAMH 1704) TaxID=336963 RepID=C4JPP5_UNCRE|nr:uncharacterized protein UREG_03217 [Uncinocarpus reesii 1704]EEP78371.1 predicted protein [Uncinocarpus reesii 1704]